MKAVVITLTLISAALVPILGFKTRYDANLNYIGNLNRAANANTVELATKELEKSVSYLEQNGITKGNTGVIFKTPQKDVGFWFDNLKASLNELKSVSPEASQLEKSNVLMKLRETLLDNGENGSKLAAPSGIIYFPNNGLWLIAWIYFYATFVIGLIALRVSVDN